MLIFETPKFFIYLSLIISAFLSFSAPISSNIVVADNTQSSTMEIIDKKSTDVKTKDLVSILDFGAKGDGITDDTNAIQKAIYYAGKNDKTVLLPPTDSYYLVSDYIYLTDNTSITGYGATIYMKPQDQSNAILYSDDNDYISNVHIEGLSFLSSNTKAGTGIFENSLTSNVEAMCFYGVGNLTLKDIRMDNMHRGLKLGDNAYGIKNADISIDNLSIYNSRIPVYISSSNNLYMSNSILDANGGSDQRLHCVYIDGNTSNFYFEKVVFRNSSGGGIHIYKEDADKKPAQNMIFTGCTIEDCKVGAYIWSEAEDIKVLKTTIRNSDLAFHIEDAYGVEISEVDISEFTNKYDGNKGAFFINRCYQSKITNININCDTMGGSLFELATNINDLLISSLNVLNMNDCEFFNTTSGSIKGLVVEDSTFEWDVITKPKISFRGSGSEAIFRNNGFYNNSKTIAYLCFNFSDTNVTMVNNSLKGLKENLVNR